MSRLMFYRRTPFQFLVILSLLLLCIPVFAAGEAGYWDFNDGSGLTAADRSGNGNNGILSSGVRWASAKFGSGVQFDSINDYVTVPESTDLNFNGDFTVSMWINPSDWKTWEPLLSNGVVRIFHRGDATGDYVYFLRQITSTSASPGDSAWGGWAGVKTIRPVPENEWSSIIGVKSGNIMTIYIDGVKAGDVNVLSGYTLDNSGLGDLLIGGDGKINFNGGIDEVKIWNRALTTNEVLNLYNYPPTLSPIGNIVTNEDTSIRITPVTMDAYNRSLSYSVSSLPSGAQFSQWSVQEFFPPYSSGAQFFWTPSSGQVGDHTICFSVSNGGASDRECITITVQRNCLLHDSLCPSDFVCQGDGVCREDVSRFYGADAKPTSDPLGGGVGYSHIINPTSADYTVSTRSQLLNALQNARSGQIVYVTDSAKIDLTGDNHIPIPAGVTLASGRGSPNSAGALLYTNTLYTSPLFTARGEDVRITGLRLQGPDPERKTEKQLYWHTNGHVQYEMIPESEAIKSEFPNLEVDNCELFGWNHAAIELVDGSHDDYIHHNYIHHNQREGLGYGVCVRMGTNALIEANIFDWNRHAINGEAWKSIDGVIQPVTDSSKLANYEARYNLVLGNANGHNFDMHGGNDIPNAAVYAGGYVNIHHNTFIQNTRESTTYPVAIRGIPKTGVDISQNWVAYNSSYTEKLLFRQVMDNLPGHTPYEKMWVSNNWYGASPPPETITSPVITPTRVVTPSPGIISETIAFYQKSTGAFFLKNSNDAGNADAVFQYGAGGDDWSPLVGDWNNNGVDTVGLYQTSTGAFFLKNSNGAGNADILFPYGAGGDDWVHLAGDWDGDGDDTVGAYQKSIGAFFLKNSNAAGNADIVFRFGWSSSSGDLVPLAGDWDGDGDDTVGLYEKSTGTFLLKNSNSGGNQDTVFQFGWGSRSGDLVPLAGDWDDDGDDTVGVYQKSTGTYFLKNSNSAADADTVFQFGWGGEDLIPLSGRW